MVKKFVMLFCLICQITACSSTSMEESTGEYIDSSAITTKVKSRLFDKLGSDAFSIKVKTYKDHVQLSGFVNAYDIKRKAGTIAYDTIGVKNVRNDLIVKNGHL